MAFFQTVQQVFRLVLNSFFLRPLVSSISKDLETASGCDWSESHPLWIFSSTRLWRPGHRKNVQLQVPAGSWISIDSGIVSCNNWDVWDSQNTQKRFLAVKNYFKEMFRCYIWRCRCMWHGLWRYKLWFLHHCTKRMAHGGCPSSNNHKTWTRRQTLQKLEFKGWNLKPNNPS